MLLQSAEQDNTDLPVHRLPKHPHRRPPPYHSAILGARSLPGAGSAGPRFQSTRSGCQMLTPSPSRTCILQLRDTSSDEAGFQLRIRRAGKPPGTAQSTLFPTRSPIHRSDVVRSNEEDRDVRCVANSRAGAPPTSAFFANSLLGVIWVQSRINDENNAGQFDLWCRRGGIASDQLR